MMKTRNALDILKENDILSPAILMAAQAKKSFADYEEDYHAEYAVLNMLNHPTQYKRNLSERGVEEVFLDNDEVRFDIDKISVKADQKGNIVVYEFGDKIDSINIQDLEPKDIELRDFQYYADTIATEVFNLPPTPLDIAIEKDINPVPDPEGFITDINIKDGLSNLELYGMYLYSTIKMSNPKLSTSDLAKALKPENQEIDFILKNNFFWGPQFKERVIKGHAEAVKNGMRSGEFVKPKEPIR